MTNDRDVLLVVDVQNDFLPGGALAVPDGDAIVGPINVLARRFAHVVLTQDWHPAGHLSFASSHAGRAPFSSVVLDYGAQVLWPDHCVQGTRGAAFSALLGCSRCRLRGGRHRGCMSRDRHWRLARRGVAPHAARRCGPFIPEGLRSMNSARRSALHVALVAGSCLMLVQLLAPKPSRAADVPTIAAAADLQFALVHIAEAFERGTGKEVKLVFGSSGSLARQIAAGAPFQMFMSADESIVDSVVKSGRAQDKGTIYAVGRLTLFVPAGSRLPPNASLGDLKAAAVDGRVQKLAIANPEIGPYGRAAREALVAAGVWDSVSSKLVLGENVVQAAQLAASGAAQAAIVADALAHGPSFAGRGSFVRIPASLHKPLRERMVLIKNAGGDARAFYEYVRSPPAQNILRRNGFAPPDE